MAKVRDEPLAILIDSIKWDLNTPNAMLGVYAARLAQDLGLGLRAAIIIENELKRSLYKAQQKVAAENQEIIKRPEVGHQVREAPSKFPKLLVGDQAKAVLEQRNAKKHGDGLPSPK